MDDEIDPAPAKVDGTEPEKGRFSQVPIEVIISVGKAHPAIGDLLRLRNNSVLALDQKVTDPVELYVGNQLIARGTLEELEGGEEGQLAVRLTEVAAQNHDP